MGEIPESQLSDMQEKYRDQTGKTYIYFGKWNQPGSAPLDVAVKVIFTQGMLEPYTYIEECSNQLRIDSPHVCKIYGWNIQAQRMMIVMERLQGDLAKEITMRREQSYFFREEELLEMCWQVVSVFAELQRMNISHNDIKAENIFVHKLNGKITYKVGDFGSACTIRTMDHFLTGTPLYLSPILKREFALYNQSKQRKEIHYNTFKSDVFSLGVTLIFAGELVVPNDLLDISMLTNKIESHIRNLSNRFPKLSWLMSRMLQIDETNRWDFIEIETWLASHVFQGRALPGQRPNSQPLSRSESLNHTQVLDFVAELQPLYRHEMWESMKAVLVMAKDSGELPVLEIEAVCQCHTCAEYVKYDTFCAVCRSTLGEI